MEVLPRSLAATCSRSQSSNSSGVRNVGRRAPQYSSSSSLTFPILASSASLLALVPASVALSYEDFINGADKAPPTAPDSFYDAADSFFFIDFDAATDFMTANPVAFLAGLAAVAVPLIAFTALANPQTFGTVSAGEAFATLSSPEQNAQLLDIRALEDIKAEGTPNLKSLKKKAVQIPYDASDANAFVAKALSKLKDPENTTLFILDRLDGNALAVAKLLANNGFKGAFAIKGGAEGPNGWKRNELPWLVPRKGFSFNLDGLKDILNGTDASSLVPTTLGVAAAAGIGAAVFTEAESALQLLGSAAIIQIFVKKFMFAKDREKTIEELTAFLDTKIAPKDLVDDVKEVGKAFLPKDGEKKIAIPSGNAAVVEKNSEAASVAAAEEAVAGKVA